MKIRPLKVLFDERGFFSELYRQDWKELLGEDQSVQANLSRSHPCIIRAWHKHMKGQTDYFIVLTGALKICAYNEKTSELAEVVSTGKNLQIVRVPGHYWHGFKVVSPKPASLLYFTTKLYDYESPDEERRPWNDKSIIPKTINGKKGDPRIGKSYDWNYPPHK